jgi:hypothetical protein
LVVLPLAEAGAQDLYSISRDDDQLRVIDPADGSTIGSPTTITLSGSTISGGNGLATDPLTGISYALLKLADGFPFERYLVTLDLTTGVASMVGNTGARFAGIAFDSGGTLYGVTGDGEQNLVPETLYSLSLSDGAPTFEFTLGNGGPGEAIAFNPVDGLLYHASGIDDGVNPDDRVFEKIDLVTEVVTDIPLSGDGYREIAALAYYEGEFLATEPALETLGNGVMLSLSDAGVVSFIGSTDHSAKGLLPEPGGLAGLMSGLLLLRALARRREQAGTQ